MPFQMIISLSILTPSQHPMYKPNIVVHSHRIPHNSTLSYRNCMPNNIKLNTTMDPHPTFSHIDACISSITHQPTQSYPPTT